IWLGLLAFPVLYLHTGFRWGGWLSVTLWILFCVVIVSGIYGLILQNIIPRQMYREGPAETIYSQIEYVSNQLASEARQLVLATCGPEEEASGTPPPSPQPTPAPAGVLVVGKPRAAGEVQGKVLATLPAQPIPRTEAIRSAFV